METDLFSCLAGFLGGIAFMIVSKAILSKIEDVTIWDISLDSEAGKKIVLLLAAMTLHSGAEGVGMGVAFAGERGPSRGILINSILALHNIPEGTAIALVSVPRGVSPTSAVFWAIFSSMLQPIIAVPSFIFVEVFQNFTASGLGFAGGAMGWMIFFELIPEAFCHLSKIKVFGMVFFTSMVTSLVQEVFIQNVIYLSSK